MLQSLWTAPLLCLLVSAPVPDETTTLLDRVIKAQGGDEKLSKAKGATFTTKGTAGADGMKAEIKGDVAVQGVDRIRWNFTFTAMGREQSGTLVVTAEKIWAKGGGGNGDTEEAPKEEDFIHDVFRTIRLSQNLSALRNKEVMVSHLGEVKIDNRAAVGLKVASKGRPDVDLFFDKETSLPLRAELRVTEPMQANEVVYAFYFADYKDVNGIKQYSKMTFKRDDKTFMEMEFSDFKFQEKLDNTLFDKP